MTNEEWLEKTRPDGNVDPQPEPEPELPEEDYYIPEEEPEEKNEPEISGFNTEEEAKVKAAIDNLHVRLPNIDLKEIKIIKGVGSSGNASIDDNGFILLYNNYFKKKLILMTMQLFYIMKFVMFKMKIIKLIKKHLR